MALDSDADPRHSLSKATTIRDFLHPQWYVRRIIYLVAILHTHHHVTFHACALILTTLNLIFSTLMGNLSGWIRMPITLKTVSSRLGIEDRFTVHPVCYACHRIFDPRAPSDTCCLDCNVEIFRPAPRQLFDHMGLDESTSADDGDTSTVSREPHVVAPGPEQLHSTT
jgi:hypothetical protein